MAKDTNQENEMVVLEPVIEKYVFSRPLRGEEAKKVFDEVVARVKADYEGVPAFNRYFQYNEETGEIQGSNVPYCILANQVLGKEGLWLPTIKEAKKLDKKGKLTNGVYRDYGVAVFSAENPNSEIVQRIIEQARDRGWNLPILAPYKSVEMAKSGDFPQGLAINLNDSPAIMFGEKARQYLEDSFDYEGNSGAQWVCRNTGGSWSAYWNWFVSSNSDGRVDWLCGEATRAELSDMVLDDVRKAGEREVKEVNQRIKSAKETAIAMLRD